MPDLDLSTYLADDALTLRGVRSERHPAGKTYRVASPSAKLGLQLQRMMQVWTTRAETGAPPSDSDIADLVSITTDEAGNPVDFERRLLGDTYDELVEDGVSAEALTMIRTVVMTHYGVGGHVARELVEASGEAPARANRADRRAATRKTTGKKTAGSRSSRASTAGTGSARARRSPTSGSSTSPTPPDGQAKAV